MANSIQIDITPDKTLIKKLGLIGYRTEQAIAEIIDNSVDARIETVKEKISVQLNFENNWIGIRDDGIGMDKQDITNALIIAKGMKTDDKLGKFGIGMKSACSALGKKFKITTAKINSTKEYSTEYDEDKWLSDESLNWKNFTINERDLKPEERWHGTRITIEKLKVPIYANQISKLKERFAIRYGPYISSNQIELQLNTKTCHIVQADIEENSKEEININTLDGINIKGNIALLKKRSIQGYYGIHLFKNGRLIKAYEKFGFTNHPSIAQIIGELHLDHVPVNFQKNEFIKESPEYETAENAFRLYPAVQNTIRKARIGNEPSQSTILNIFDYFISHAKPDVLDARMSTKSAMQLFDNTNDLKFKVGNTQISIKFEKRESLYDIQSIDGNLVVYVDKNNPVFKYSKNPLSVIGMIASEVELVAKNPTYGEFVQQRNKNWSRFLEDWSKKEPIERNREEKTLLLRNYHLAKELGELHVELKEICDYKFQFTALSTLLDFLHNILGRIIYHIYTVTGHGENLTDLISEIMGEEFVIVNDPSPDELKVVLDIEKNKKIIIVREYAEISGTTIASPEKAWVDLVNEIYTHKIPVAEKELSRVLESLMRQTTIDKDRILHYAKQYKKLDRVKPIVEAL
ncbi:MAG TPA: ATP-binding protein [Candidatus Acidoferrales bacterium]|nr:ATP-binding protein [Candidatus Acidoferrales bacterium]